MDETSQMTRGFTSGHHRLAAWLRRALPAVGVVFAACSSGGAVPLPAPAPAAQPGSGFLIVYRDHAGIHRTDTRDARDTVIAAVGPGAVERRWPPTADRAAIVFEQGGSSVVGVVDAERGGVTPLHRASAGGRHTIGWSRDGRLAVAYRPAGEPASEGGVWVMEADSLRSIGCRAGNEFLSWRANGELMVSDGRNVYAVTTADCATTATLPIRDKTHITYSPDGNRVVFYRMGSVRFANRDQPVSRPELWVAEYNGANPKKIVDAQYEIQHARWSPDGRRIAFELKSPRYQDLSHIGVHDLQTGKTTFDASERTLGVPDDSNPCWSPDGSSLAHYRRFSRSSGGESFVTLQTVVRRVGAPDERVVSEELIPTQPGERLSLSAACGWIDHRHLVLQTGRGTKIVDLERDTAYALEPGRDVLAVRVVQ